VSSKIFVKNLKWRKFRSISRAILAHHQNIQIGLTKVRYKMSSNHLQDSF